MKAPARPAAGRGTLVRMHALLRVGLLVGCAVFAACPEPSKPPPPPPADGGGGGGGGADAGLIPDAGEQPDGGEGPDAGEAEPFCGDGTCDPGEDDATCGADCGCRSVAQFTQTPPAGCRCDEACLGRGDCCADACSAFGACDGPVTHAHMNIYTTWTLLAGDLEQVEIPLTVTVDPSGQSYFWALTFSLGTEGGYIGLQTRGAENAGRLVRFSIWDATGAIVPSGSDGGCRDFDGEGVGKTCWRPFEWHEGETYVLRVQRTQSGWWRGSVIVTQTGEEVLIGDITGPPGGTLLAAQVRTFTEYYGRSLPSCDALNPAEVLFDAPSGNGGAVPGARSASSVGSSACAADFSETPVSGGKSRHRVR